MLFLAVAVAVQLARQPGLHSWDTIWAEDGRIFTEDALTLPAVQTLLRAYAGYAQFTTRVLALGTRFVPPDRLAAYLAASAAVVVALLGLVVVRSARSWVASPALRWALGAMVVIAPVTFSELTATLTNVGWHFLIAGFWAIASREQGRVDTPVRAAAVLVGALTTVTQVVLLPWAIVMAVHRRRRSDLIVLASLVAGLGHPGDRGPGGRSAAPQQHPHRRQARRAPRAPRVRVVGHRRAVDRGTCRTGQPSTWAWCRSPWWSSS